MDQRASLISLVETMASKDCFSSSES